jgi:hypothetical protein
MERSCSEDLCNPVARRIATFDNDGILWAAQSIYFQLLITLDRVKALASQHPEWKIKEPFASPRRTNVMGALAGGKSAIAPILMTTHAHVTTAEFDKFVRDWNASATAPPS